MFPKLIVVASALASLSTFEARSSQAAVIASQGFEAVPAANNWGYTSVGGAVSNNKGPTDSPEINARVIEGSQSFQVIPPTSVNTTATLNFVPIATSAFGGNSISIRLAAHAVGLTSGNGMEIDDTVKVYIALDVPLGTAASAVTYLATPDLTVAGNTNARWTYAAGTGTATANITQVAANRTPVSVQPGTAVTPNNRTTDGYSTLILNLPDTASSFAMKIVLTDDTNTEAWVMDNILVNAVPEPATIGMLGMASGLLLRRRYRAAR